MHFEFWNKFKFSEAELTFQRLGAEETAGAIADMYENHDAVRITGAYLGLPGL